MRTQVSNPYKRLRLFKAAQVVKIQRRIVQLWHAKERDILRRETGNVRVSGIQARVRNRPEGRVSADTYS